MSDQLYETWWYNSSEGGFYYRGRWYATEADLNSAGYYKVYTRGLSLGSTRYALKYQKDLYQLPDGSFKTYEHAHAEGWAERRSFDRVFIRLSDYTILIGYYNTSDGYYVEGVWHDTESDLNTAGYLVGEEEVTIYSTTSLTTYKAIKNQSYGYFIADPSYPSWLSESDLEALDLSLLLCFLPIISLFIIFTDFISIDFFDLSLFSGEVFTFFISSFKSSIILFLFIVIITDFLSLSL